MKKKLITGLAVFALVAFPGIAYADTYDYNAIGEQWMQEAMGDQYGDMEALMEERFGTDAVDRMHENMGRMAVRGYDGPSMMGGNWNSGYWSGGGWLMIIIMAMFALLFWGGLLLLLALAIVRLWQAVSKEKQAIKKEKNKK